MEEEDGLPIKLEDYEPELNKANNRRRTCKQVKT